MELNLALDTRDAADMAQFMDSVLDGTTGEYAYWFDNSGMYIMVQRTGTEVSTMTIVSCDTDGTLDNVTEIQVTDDTLAMLYTDCMCQVSKNTSPIPF